MVRSKLILNSRSGFTLMELIVASGIGVLISSVAVFAFVMTMDTYIRMVRQYEAETEMVTAIMTTRSVLSNAIQMNYCGETGVANNDITRRGVAAARRSTEGCVLHADLAGCADGTTYLVSLGVRDMNATGNVSDLFGFGIYYQCPNAAGTRSGALYIDQEQNAAGGWVETSPVNAPFMFTRLVGFELGIKNGATDINGLRVVNPTTNEIGNALQTGGNNYPMVSAEISLTMRYFTKREGRFNWKPASALTAAEELAVNPFYDIKKTFKVTFANSAIERTRLLTPRPFGKVHLFKFGAGSSRSN